MVFDEKYVLELGCHEKNQKLHMQFYLYNGMQEHLDWLIIGILGEHMGKLIVLTVSENEEQILSNIQRYLQSEVNYTDIISKQEMTLFFSNLEIDLYRREVRQNQKVIKLTDLEFRILYYLASQPERVFTYQQIYEGVWGEEYAHEKGNIMSHIRHIRQKLESDEGSFDYIENIRGVGYRFKKPMTDSS
jgi:DNA-binding winged helix-turn-helix (wHTH) protein